MNRKLYDILIKWLTEAGYKIDLDKFEISLLSHPDYNGLTAITDTFTEFNIEHTASNVPIAALPNLTEPFVTIIKQDYQEQFALIYPQNDKNIKIYLGEKQSAVISIDEFKALWTGTIVAIEKKTGTKKILLKPQTLTILLIPAILLLLFSLFSQSIYSLINFNLALIGLYISSLIVNYQLGYSKGISSKFCSLSKNTDCESVLNSKAAKLTTNIGLSDLGIIYFTLQLFIYLLSGNFSLPVNNLLYSISLLAFPFIGYSFYQQKFVIKKWCPLCLGVIGILFIQGIIAALSITASSFLILSGKSIIYSLSVLVFVILIWVLLKPLLKGIKTLNSLYIESLSFRRNYHLLLPYLQNQPTVCTDFNFKTIQLGNPFGLLKLTLITNPLCDSCIKLHKILEAKIQQHKELSVQLVFNVPLNIKDQRTLVAGHLLSKHNLGLNESLCEWHKKPNTGRFINEHSNEISNDTIKILERHKQWCDSNDITVTPALYVNSKRFPTFYMPTDIKYFIEELLSASSESTNREALNMVLASNT